MATKIRGITIELGADYSQVTDAFKKVTKELNQTTKSLKDVDKLLKLDPSNVELLAQKQGYLEDAIEQTSQKLLEEKTILENLPKGEDGEQTEQQKALAREIEATSLQLQKYQSELEATKSDSESASVATEELAKDVKESGESAEKSSSKGEISVGVPSSTAGWTLMWDRGAEVICKNLSRNASTPKLFSAEPKNTGESLPQRTFSISKSKQAPSSSSICSTRASRA